MPLVLNQDNFYTDCPVLDRFENVTENHYFRPVPRDWTIFITDVKDSTEAIRQGKYRDVNLIGASSVAMARNVLDTLEFPFAFGGDGATMLIPPGQSEELQSRLSGLQSLAKRQFQLDLRAGAVPVDVLDNRPASLEVARYEVSPGVSVAIFRGGGTSVAEELFKQEPDKYRVSENDPPDIDLDGLSCRWKPIPSKRDSILSLLVLARTERKQNVYRKVLDKLNTLYDGQLRRGNPVNTSGLKYRSFGSCYRDEKRYFKQGWSLSYLTRIMEILIAVLIFRWKLPLFFVNADHYRNALPNHSDYRKFDDMLRMTIDCNTAQLNEIIDYLDGLFRDEEVFYGHHVSSEALMTCFVENMNDGGHIHFIDGGNGGYAMAAVQLKRQIQRESTRLSEKKTGDDTSRPSL